MSTLETAESVLGISDRGADRLEDEMDDVRAVGGGTDGAVAGASGRSFLDINEEDEVRVSSVCCVRFCSMRCFTRVCIPVRLDVCVFVHEFWSRLLGLCIYAFCPRLPCLCV